MATSLQRRKPGYTRNGEVRIVSLSYKQLAEQLSKASKKKIQSKIRGHMRILETRKGFVNPITPTVSAE
jgi:hypothetical protein